MRLLPWIYLLGISNFAAAEIPPPCTGETREFLVEVRSPSGEPQEFEGVIAYHGELEIVEAITPYTFEFAASRIMAMFSSDTPVTASLYVRNGDGRERVGYISDSTPAIYESVSCNEPLLRVFGRY